MGALARVASVAATYEQGTRAKESRRRPRRRRAAKIKAAPLELDLLRVLLADPSLVAVAQEEVPPQWIEHPRLRLLLEGFIGCTPKGRFLTWITHGCASIMPPWCPRPWNCRKWDGRMPTGQSGCGKSWQACESAGFAREDGNPERLRTSRMTPGPGFIAATAKPDE